jgi:PAS domain S-box-containing protein
MKALKNNKQINLKVRINSLSDSTAGWIRFYGQIEFDSTGRPLYIILYIEDITQVEKLLIDRSLIIESIADNFYVLDRNFNFVYYNKNYRTDYLNAKGDEFIGTSVYTVFPFLADSAFSENLKKAADTGEAVHFEFEVHVDGEFRGWYEQHFYPFATGYSVLFRNITDRKKIEQDLLKLNMQLKINTEELTNTNTELERFAYVASHDLQEPLRMVSSFMQLFEKKYAAAVDDTGKQYIRFAVEGADRMKILIRDLLQYSRAGSGSLEIVDVDMNEVMNEIQLIFKNEAANSNADIITQSLPVIKAGKTAMLQLMQNLISNALKYNNKEKAVITISGDENEREWIIRVKDNGIGIEPEFAEKIFVIFQRLHTKEQYGGTGIGLSVCKKIVERYKGKIWVESVPGIGSDFIFTIPKTML